MTTTASPATVSPVTDVLTVGLLVESEVVRAGLRRLLTPVPQMHLVTDITSRLDVLLVDEASLIDSRQHASLRPTARTCVIALSPGPDKPSASVAQPSDPHRWISLRVDAITLAREIETAHRDHYLQCSADEASESDGGLTEREAEILRLICACHTNQEIADLLFLSVNSIKSHIRTLYRKIGVTRRSQAVAWGLARGY